MTIEEKAKAYYEAIDKVAYFIKKHIGLGCMIHPNSSEAKELFNIFPELKESEDERIKKEIIDYIKTGTYHKDWIAWLEKQGEIDNVPLEGSTNTIITDSKKNKVEPKDYFDIPFGAKDSELQEASYHIPEGFYVEIKGNKLIIKKDESILL